MNVTVRQLRAFVAVAQLSGFSAAATRLHLTQSTLSTLVRTLEDEIGVALFERTTRSVKLTDAGRGFLASAEKMLTELHSAVAGTRQHAERARGRLIIAVTPTFSGTLLPRLLAQYREAYPDVQVVLRDEATPRQIRTLVQEGEADIGIGPLERGEREWFVIDVLMDDELMLACPVGHPLAGRKRVAWGDLADLADLALIGFPRDNGLQVLIDQSLTANGVRLRPLYEVASIATAASLVAQGLGVAILPSYARQHQLGERIRYKPLLDPVVKRDLCLLRLRDRAMPPTAQRFIEVVLDGLREGGGLRTKR